MNKLKAKIRKLEAEIIMDRQAFTDNTYALADKIYELKDELYVLSLIFAGLSFGYAMGPGKGSIFNRITTATMFLVNTSQLVNNIAP